MSAPMKLLPLEEIGLTSSESKVFQAILRIGSSKAAPIVQETRLQNSVVHLALGKLIQKGFVTYVKQGNVRYFQAAHPNSLKKLIEEKQSRLKKLLPQLNELYQPFQRQDAEVFEGRSGFYSMLYRLIEDGEKGDEYLFFAFRHSDPQVGEEVYPIYAEYEQERFQRGLKLRGIVPSELRKHYATRRQENLMYVDFPVLQNLSIFRDKVSMTPWGKRKISFLLTSMELADQYRETFERIWKAGKLKRGK